MIEVLVVLVVLAVLAGLILPRMTTSVDRQALREAAAAFAHTARAARELAVSTQKPTAIEMDLDHGLYGVAMQSSGPGASSTQVTQASWLKAGRWPATVEVKDYRTPARVSYSSGVQRLEFFTDGTSSGASIQLAGAGDECNIIVHPHNGRVVIAKDDSDPSATDQYDLGD